MKEVKNANSNDFIKFVYNATLGELLEVNVAVIKLKCRDFLEGLQLNQIELIEEEKKPEPTMKQIKPMAASELG